MSPDHRQELDDFAQVLAAARAGSAEALGQLLMHCRNYLLLVANRGMEPDLQGKVSPSDLVQETFLEAQRDFRQFHGDREDELLAWLCRILHNNVANVSRHYRSTAKRALDREVPLAGGGHGSGPVNDLRVDTPSPSDHVAAREQTAALEAALAKLPENYRAALRLRYQENLTFAQIGAALGCSGEAARKLWARAVDRLQKLLDFPDAS